jgi:ABC-type glutathione transport system ATPase component
LDHDVLEEAKRVEYADKISIDEPLVVRNLIKKYKKKGKRFNAVDNLSFGIQSSECFG